jgi:carboxylate-amine ligase
MAELAQQLLIFGTHVHIGIEDRGFLIDAMNVARYFAPHILCLTASSPFWMGRNTGLRSYRSIIFRHFPRSGIPPEFGSWAELELLVDTLVKTRCVPDGTKLWWDVRPNWRYPTLEFRICDVCTKVDEAVCVAAIFQAIIAKLWKLRHDNMTFRHYPTTLIEENKWRAVRYGLDGKLLDLGKQREVPARDLIHELIDWFLRDVIDELGTRKEIEYAYEIMKHGSGADRQLREFERTNDLKSVVDLMVRETREGVSAEGRSP